MSSSEIKVQVLRQTLSTKRRHYLDWSHNFDKTRRCVTSQKNCHGFSGTFGSWSVGYKVCGTFWSASSLYPIWNLVTYWLVELLPWSSKPERLAGLSVGQKEKKNQHKVAKNKTVVKTHCWAQYLHYAFCLPHCKNWLVKCPNCIMLLCPPVAKCMHLLLHTKLQRQNRFLLLQHCSQKKVCPSKRMRLG